MPTTFFLVRWAALSFETGAEPVIGPRFARTRWRPPQDEADRMRPTAAAASIF
jgi:hypothetical protein